MPKRRTQPPSPLRNTFNLNATNAQINHADVPPRRALFTVGNDSAENLEHWSPPNRSKNAQPKISFETCSPLQNMFVPPEDPRRAEAEPSADRNSHLSPPERRHPESSHGSDTSQDGLDRIEEINQLTVQTVGTDFVIPVRKNIKPIWARRDPEFPPPPRPGWLAGVVRFFKNGRRELAPSAFRHIVKSSIAFFLASLIVIIDPVRDKIGSYAYMAPFITVLFDNTRTIGAQLEISLLTCGFLAIGLVYYLLAFGLFAIYNRGMGNIAREGLIIFDGAFIIALFFFLAMFILGWLRARFAKLASPAVLLSFFLAISMTNLSFGEFDDPYHQFGWTLAPALIGLAISLLVNLILWPESASQGLGESLELSLQHAHRSLKLLTSCFLLDPDSKFVRLQDLEDLHTRSMDAATALVKAGREARYEYTYSVHPPADYRTMIETILSLNQQLSGFNLAVQREHQLLGLNKAKGDNVSLLSSRSTSLTEIRALSLPPSPSALSLNKLAEEMLPVAPEIDPHLARSIIHDILHFVKDPLVSLNAVSLLAIHVALKSLAEKDAMDAQPPAAAPCPTDSNCHHAHPPPADPEASVSLADAARQLRLAISEFEVAEGRCLHLIHRQLLFTPHLHAPFPEPMLVVFSGVFSVREFAKELLKLLEEVERFHELRPKRGKRKSRRLWRPRVGLAKWLRGHRTSEEPRQAEFYANEDINLPYATEQARRDHLESQEDLELGPDPEDPLVLPDQRWTKPEYSRAGCAASNPEPRASLLGRVRWRVWRFSRSLTSYEVRFGFKLMLAMILLTFPAYVPALSDLYAKVNGPWGAIAAMFIINKTIGGTLYLGLARLAGTVIGATWGYVTCLASNNISNVYLVVAMIWIFNAPAWYAIITTDYSRIGFTGMTTYCAVLFVNYGSIGSGEILMVAVIRTLSVIIGLVVSMLITSTLWPYVARNEVRKVVAGLMADMGVNFGKVAALCMTHHGAPLRVSLDAQIRSQQHQLQKRLLAANTLLTFANREPRLKGPFASGIYREQLRVLQDILDQLVAMRGAVLQIGPEVQATVIIPFNAYRKFMVSSVILYFYVLAGSLRAKHPLPPYPPPIHAIRYKLMVKTRAAMVRRYRKSHPRASLRRDISSGALKPCADPSDLATVRREFNHIYWYTYMAGLVRLFEDMELLGHNVAEIVGESTLPAADPLANLQP
ncbi:hypothetical protein L0F63_004540 [Massospora cicadina]|nr:hypothetical protein L0F63_004540 [Massospora cicadina]